MLVYSLQRKDEGAFRYQRFGPRHLLEQNIVQITGDFSVKRLHLC